MTKEEAHKHHFVPQFALRPWMVEGALWGYWWNQRRNELACKKKRVRGFCWQLDLLTLYSHNLGRDALERVFFGDIDTKSAEIRDCLLNIGLKCLNIDQKCDFARFLLSLEARRPMSVSKIRNEGKRYFAESIDNDPEIIAAMTNERISEAPSSYLERNFGVLLEDRALAAIQRLVDNPKVGGRLINAYWHVVHLGPYDGTFILADRPLIRLRGYDHPGAAWLLPLTPRDAFVAVNHSANLERIKRVTPRRFAKKLNVSSAAQAERYVFSVEASYQHWVGKYLRAATG